MPDKRIVDPFKPAQPRIPGVSTAPANSPSVATREENYAMAELVEPRSSREKVLFQLKFLWIGLTLAGALITGLILFSLSQRAASIKPAVPAESAQKMPSFEQAAPIDPKLPMGPGEIATTTQLAKPWSAKRFTFHDPLTLKNVPAMVVRLPGGNFWGFSLQEPFGGCQLEYVTDLRKLRSTYNFDASYPMVVDPCNGTIFDLTHYGSGPSGLVRGEIAKGSGWRPPTAIEIRVEGGKVIAQRMEE